MWKFLTGVIAEEKYDYLEEEKLLPEEQKGCKRRSPGTKDRLLIDKTVLKEYKKRHSSLFMTWVDYKRAYDFVLNSWINDCIELFGIAGNERNLLENSIEQWKVSLTSNGEDLGEADVKRGILHRENLS